MSNKYGSITVDGDLSDWTLGEELDNANTTVAGYNVYGAYLLDSANAPNYVLAINSTTSVAIGAGTTIYLNTDNNKATGYQVFGGEVGADYEVVFDSTDTPYLWSWNSMTSNWVQVGTTALDFAFNGPTDKSVELAIPLADLAGAPTSIQADISLNGAAGVSGATYLPNDFSFADVVSAPVTVGGIVLDGAIADWPSAPLVQIPANASPNYNVYGQLVTDATLGNAYVIGVMPTAAGAADPVIGASTFIYLNTDQNASTGYEVFGANVGADFVVKFQLDSDGNLQPYLYSASAAGVGATPLNGGQPLPWSPSSGANGFEIAIPQSLLSSGGVTPTSINFTALINNSVALPGNFFGQPEFTINDTAAITPPDHSVKKIAIVYSQETADNYFKGATDNLGNPIPQASLTTAYNDLFMTAQDQADAAGVPYDIITADQLATMTAAQLSQYSALVIPSMTNVQDEAQAQQITGVLSALESQYGVGIITSGNFMTADASNVALATPYLAMQTLLGTTFSTSGTGTFSVSVDPNAASNPIMASYAPGQLIGGDSGQFAGDTTGYYTNTGYNSFVGLSGSNPVTLADINVTTAPGSPTTQSLAGVLQTTNNGSTNTLFSTTGLFGDSNLLQNVIQHAVYGNGPALAIDMTRFAGMVDSRTDMDQSQFAADIKPSGGGPGIYDEMLPIIQQWAEQYNFVGSFYMNAGNGAAGSDNAGNNLTLTTPYMQQLIQLGSEIGSHSTDHLINPPTVDANGNPIQNTVINGEQVNSWSENTNTLYVTPPTNNSAPNWTYSYEFGNSNALINAALGITISGAAVPGAGDTSADALNILPYYAGANGNEGYLSGGWTGVGSGSPNAFGYISPANQNSVYIAPNITFDFSEIQYDGKTPTQSLDDWVTLFNQMSANSNTPIIVWPWHDYGVTDWNTTTDAPGAGLYSTAMYTSFVQYAYNAGYEFVTSEDLAARIAAEQRAVIKETNPTANTINVSVTPGVATDDLGEMALNLTNDSGQVIENAGSWYAYDGTSLYIAKGGVNNVTVTLGSSAQTDVTHIDYLPMRADLLSVSGDGANLSFSFSGDSTDLVDAYVKTPGANIISVQGGPNLFSAGLSADGYLSMNFDDTTLALSPTSGQAALVVNNVVISDGAAAVTSTGTDFLFGGSADDLFTISGGTDYIDGGGGVNTMKFNGALANYAISVDSGGFITVIDKRAGSPDGTVTVTKVQYLQFADTTISTTPTTVPTTVLSATPSPTSGDLGIGKTVTITAAMSGPETVTGAPELQLNDGGFAVYNAAASTPTSLAFTYTVASGQNTSALAVTGYVANGGSITELFGVAADMTGATSTLGGLLQIDTTPPAAPTMTPPSYTGTTTSGHWNLSGAAETASTVKLYDRTLATPLIGTLTDSAADGSWSYAGLTSNAANSLNVAHDFYATATDAAGNLGAASGDYWVGSAGNNTFTFASEPALLHGGVWGNGGTDTVAFSAPATLTDADFASVHLGGLSGATGVTTAMTLALNGASTVTLGANAAAAKFTAITAGNGDTAITDGNSGTLGVNAAAITSGHTLTLAGAASESVTNANTLTIAAAGLASAATLTVASGSATGAVTVTGLVSTLTGTSVKGTLNVTTGAAASIKIATSTVNPSTTTINASAMTAGETLTLTGSRAATVQMGGNLSAGAYTGSLTVTATGAAAQTITVGGGFTANTFVYASGASSLDSAFDTITSYSILDHFKIGHTVSTANFHSLTATASGNLNNDLVALLTSGNLAATGADVVSLTGGGSDAGSYVVINNAGTAGFNSASDAVIKLSAGATVVSASSFTA